MKILVFSDSHGNREDMVLAVEAQRPDAVFHLGDCWRDAEDIACAFPNLPLYQVPGNCDWFQVDGVPTEKVVILGRVRFMLCHGHVFGVKSGYSTAVDRARRAEADVLLCGHTHRPYFEQFGSVQVFNPGSVRDGGTYGVITVENGMASCSVQHI